MPDNKKHHYVPKFYLKNFSLDEKLIPLYNLKSNKFIKEASITGQCYQDYFYGKNPELEKGLGDLEGNAATILRNAIDNNVIPQRFTSEHLTLIQFIAAQLGRTEAAEAEFNTACNHFAKTFIKHEAPELLSSLEDFSIQLKSPVLETISTTISMYPIFIDLDFKLLVTKNDAELITSDNPLILFNQCFPSNTPLTHGMASKGLLIYLPISPQKAFIFYDSHLYKMKNSQDDIVYAFPFDVHKLNVLQYFSCNENLYFCNESSISDIEKIASEYTSLRPKERIKVTNKEVTDAQGRKAELMTTTHLREINPKLNLIVAKEKHSVNITQGVRNPPWVQIIRDFTSALENKSVELENFPDFVFYHPLSRQVDFLFQGK